MRHADLPTVLACGAWLKNAACLLVDGEPVWSPVHGDLGTPAACLALEASMQRLLAAHAAPIAAVAHDLHPDFFSTRLAVSTAASLGVPAIGVQHHHAHIAAVAAEHRLVGPVIGLALDGVGLGTRVSTHPGPGAPVLAQGDEHAPAGRADEFTTWGGELLLVDGATFSRLGHLQALPLPGGDRAAREPWRMAASALHTIGRGAEIPTRFAPLVGDAAAAGVRLMLTRGLNCPLTSSTGRWFDAAAAALGLCLHQADEAQAAIALEDAAARWLSAHPETAPLEGAVPDARNRLLLGRLFEQLLDVPTQGIDETAAGFHLALADALADWARRAGDDHRTRQVCLGGGCFFNRILRHRVTARLEAAGFSVYSAGEKGCGDAALALGQAWVAALRMMPDRLRPALRQESEPCV